MPSSGTTGADIDGHVRPRVSRRVGAGEPILSLGAEDLEGIREVLRRAARSSYLELAGLDVQAHPGELILKAHIYEPEDEYE